MRRPGSDVGPMRNVAPWMEAAIACLNPGRPHLGFGESSSYMTYALTRYPEAHDLQLRRSWVRNPDDNEWADIRTDDGFCCNFQTTLKRHRLKGEQFMGVELGHSYAGVKWGCNYTDPRYFTLSPYPPDGHSYWASRGISFASKPRAVDNGRRLAGHKSMSGRELVLPDVASGTLRLCNSSIVSSAEDLQICASLAACIASKASSLTNGRSKFKKLPPVMGDSRSSFHRTVCCLAQQSDVSLALDVVLGHGNSAYTLGTCFNRTPKTTWHVAGFEMNMQLAKMVSRKLDKEFGTAMMPCVKSFEAEPQGSGAQCARRRQIGSNSTHVTVIPEVVSQTGLRALCLDHMADLVILDPVSSFAPEVLGIEEICKPQYYLINNINLPGHAGWARAWLLQLGRFTELASGTLTDYRAARTAQRIHGKSEMGPLYQLRSWVLLRRQ